MFSGEVKDDRNRSGNLGAIPTFAAPAATPASSTEQEDGDGGGGSTADSPPLWLRDYKSGMEYEVYSLALHVAEESCLWGLTFRR